MREILTPTEAALYARASTCRVWSCSRRLAAGCSRRRPGACWSAQMHWPCRSGPSALAALLAIALLDELVFGALGAASPLISDDLHLDYAALAVVIGLPNLVSGAIEPAFGILADTGKQRILILAGGLAYFAA